MRALIVDKYRVNKFHLPDNIDDTYVISYKPCDTKDNVLITFDFSNGQKMIKSNGTVNIINDNTIMSSVSLVDYGIYVLKILGNKDFVYLYTYPNFEDDVYKLDISSVQEIKIGNSQECQIVHKNNSTGNIHAILRKINNKWRIENFDDSVIYVNNKKVNHLQLKTGDVVFINGIKIIFMNKFITINNPRNTVSVNGLNIYLDKNTKTNNVEHIRAHHFSIEDGN